MSNEELEMRQKGPYRLWCLHGSWVMLGLVGLFCFMGGTSYNAWLQSGTIKELTSSYERLDEKRVTRIRELTAEVSKLQLNILPEARKTAREAEKTAKAAQQVLEIKSAPQTTIQSAPGVHVHQSIAPPGN